MAVLALDLAATLAASASDLAAPHAAEDSLSQTSPFGSPCAAAAAAAAAAALPSAPAFWGGALGAAFGAALGGSADASKPWGFGAAAPLAGRDPAGRSACSACTSCAPPEARGSGRLPSAATSSSRFWFSFLFFLDHGSSPASRRTASRATRTDAAAVVVAVVIFDGRGLRWEPGQWWWVTGAKEVARGEAPRRRVRAAPQPAGRRMTTARASTCFEAEDYPKTDRHTA
mmetsp:Transcript_20884/g.47108  ORF Transcript_20884/g.47108 Transcript_20884/m.47108 type:complete len:229 (-) Transcript_20884:67-753(-)